MGCCKARTLTWIVAILHMVITPLGVCLYGSLFFLSDSQKDKLFTEYDTQKSEIFHMAWVGTLYCLLALAATITLIVGLMTNRQKLLEPFKIIIYMGGVYWVFSAIRLIYRGIRDHYDIEVIIADAVLYIILAVFQCICYIPVQKLRKQMRMAERNLPEQHGLRNNKYLNRPY